MVRGLTDDDHVDKVVEQLEEADFTVVVDLAMPAGWTEEEPP